jgi:hypothetical protein
MSELNSGERTEDGIRRLGVKHIDVDKGISIEVGHDGPTVTDRLRKVGRKAVDEIVDLANALSPPPPERLPYE